ncbi:MAG: hypothetical protein ACFHWX_02570 [Bacteroidota bacterium]
MEALETLATPFHILLYIGNSLVAVSVFLLLLYVIQVQGIRSRSKKYKFVSERESKSMKGAAILFSSGISCYSFVIIEMSIGITGALYYFISTVLSIGIGLMVGYTLYVYLSYYHPFVLEKRLKDIRFGPMISPTSGTEMTLLNETQEDKFMTKEMIEEEETSAVDYDVWIDKHSDYKVIERYDTRFHPEECRSCNFRTLMERRSEVVKQPTQHEKGLLRKSYECTYCGHIESKDVTLSSLAEEGKYESFEKDVVEIPKHKMART